MPVTIAAATIEAVPIEIQAIGTVEASSSVSVRARVSGQLLRVHFTEGQDVAEGDVLFSIDPRPFQAALRQAEASLRRDQTQAENAAREAQRYAALVTEGVASREDADAKRSTADALAATVQADQAALANSRLQLDFTTVRAPMAARTGSIQVREGNIVQADTTELVVLNRLRPVFVSFILPEQRLDEVRQSMAGGPLRVAAALPEDPGTLEHGTVTFIDNAIDRATGTIRLKGTFANDAVRLWPGQFVQTTILLKTVPDAVVVPSPALQTSQAGTFVFVVAPDRTAQMRPVEVGAQSPGGRVIVTKGIEAGELVVTDGQIRLSPGAQVAIQERPESGRDAGPEGGP